jgi:hypothetical protein
MASVSKYGKLIEPIVLLRYSNSWSLPPAGEREDEALLSIFSIPSRSYQGRNKIPMKQRH